jgi:ABC-type phosphate transport system auxiliary subunit
MTDVITKAVELAKLRLDEAAQTVTDSSEDLPQNSKVVAMVLLTVVYKQLKDELENSLVSTIEKLFLGMENENGEQDA